ncbi:MAG: 5-formyltetrahydrofolate cyclo-ligase [Candidatus Omnitrophica bacterium]|nr:5-formyltetrahydrofolate cyclo-ligase [Candidatus Omnitrophota bacterium]
MLTKSQLRNKILFKLRNQKEADRNRKSRIIREKLFRTIAFKRAKTVMFYIAFDGEVDTQDMIKKARASGKIIAVPVCRKNRQMMPCILNDRTKLVRGLYGTLEPAVRQSLNLRELDLIIVPGVVFDKQGIRLGRGKGCYDRFLKKVHDRTPSIGLAFDFQILPSTPANSFDASVDKVIFA